MVWDGDVEEDQASFTGEFGGWDATGCKSRLRIIRSKDMFGWETILCMPFAHQPTLPVLEPRDFPQSIRRDPTSGNVVVGGYAIGAGHGLPTFECRGKKEKEEALSTMYRFHRSR